LYTISSEKFLHTCNQSYSTVDCNPKKKNYSTVDIDGDIFETNNTVESSLD